jgi:hypothetical protein
MARQPAPPAAAGAALSRRRLLQLGLAAGSGVAAALAGCRRGDAPTLVAATGSMPGPWLEALPHPWQRRLLGGAAAVVQALEAPEPETAGPLSLASLPDGWAVDLPARRLQPFGTPAVLARLAAFAQPVSRLHGPPERPALAFPWAFSPWVIVLRSQPDLADRARGAQGWGVLADPALRGRLVLPSSPRVSIEICGGDLRRLRALRAQAMAYDDGDALNLLLTGEAAAAVVPLQRLVPLLRRDQRLQVVLPATGAPLAWQVLVRPAAGAEAPPLEWLGALLEPPLLARLLAGGWVPPLPRQQLLPSLAGVPQPAAALLLPPEAVLQRCWSLPPLSAARRLALQTLWDAAAPG